MTLCAYYHKGHVYCNSFTIFISRNFKNGLSTNRESCHDSSRMISSDTQDIIYFKMYFSILRVLPVRFEKGIVISLHKIIKRLLVLEINEGVQNCKFFNCFV